jgi:hypothetical protein
LTNSRTEWDFFIAHASQDSSSAEELFTLLSASAKVYLDTKSMRLGDDWDVVLREAQRKALVTIVIVSTATDDAFYQREEIAGAISYARATPSLHRVVPIYLDGFPGADSPVPYGLRIKHGLAISPSVTLSDAAARLLELLKEIKTDDSNEQELANDMPGLLYDLDICLCIDVGPTMDKSVERVSRELLSFPHALMAKMEERGKKVGQLRVRILTFGADTYVSMEDSDTGFVEYPAGATEVSLLAEMLKRADPPAIKSRALVTLEKAVRSRWCSTRPRVRHVIVVWSSSIPAADETQLERIINLWENAKASELDPSGKRLVIFAPEGGAWDYIINNFDNTIAYTSEAGAGLDARDSDTIMEALVSSV